MKGSPLHSVWWGLKLLAWWEFCSIGSLKNHFHLQPRRHHMCVYSLISRSTVVKAVAVATRSEAETSFSAEKSFHCHLALVSRAVKLFWDSSCSCKPSHLLSSSHRLQACLVLVFSLRVSSDSTRSTMRRSSTVKVSTGGFRWGIFDWWTMSLRCWSFSCWMLYTEYYCIYWYWIQLGIR